MRKSLGLDPRPPLDRAAARNYTLTNLLAVPGLGTWLAGRRITGALQMTTALTGFALTAGWAVGFLVKFLRTDDLPAEFDRTLLSGCAGVLLFVVSWIWSLVSSLAMLRSIQRDDAKPPNWPAT